jgi:hypothetical protein
MICRKKAMGVSSHTVLDRDYGIPMVSEVPQQCQATPIMASWPSTFLNLRCATLLQSQDVTSGSLDLG